MLIFVLDSIKNPCTSRFVSKNSSILFKGVGHATGALIAKLCSLLGAVIRVRTVIRVRAVIRSFTVRLNYFAIV